jgi:hypothetical protein
MTSPAALTWSSLLAHYSAPAWQPLAPLARTYYAQLGQLLPAAGYLALAPEAAAAPFVGNAAARQVVAAALPAPGPAADEPLTAYVERARPEAQPLLAPLLAALLAQGTSPAAFAEGLARGNDDYLAPLLDAAYWAAVAGAWQRSVQQQLDAEGRGARLLAADPTQGEALGALYARLLATQPDLTLEALRDLPANELARALWTPQPAPADAALATLGSPLHAAAQALVAANYPDAELPDRLLATVPAPLAGLAQALLAPGAAGQAPLATVAELATDPQAVLARVSGIAANHPLVYALAAWLQAAVQAVLLAAAPAPPTAPAPLMVEGQLLGAADAPLPGLVLRPTQVLTSQPGREVALGLLTTDAEGRFALAVPRDMYLADPDDAPAEAPASLRVAVYGPGQDPAGAPTRTLTLAPTADQLTYSLRTDLPLAPPASASAAVADLGGELPETLANLLADKGIVSLSDLRAAGGTQALAAGPLDEAAAAAAGRLDALAQLEVVATDAAFNEQVVAAGFSSPAQLVGSATAAEFADRLAAEVADAPAAAALRTQAIAYYQQAANVQALSQMLGLLSASTPAAPATRDASADESAAFASASFEQTDASFDQADVTFDQTDASFDQADAGFDQADAGFDQADANVDQADAPARRIMRLTGGATASLNTFNPAPQGARLPYAAAAQCDCPACRSAVSPTAYLAALLNYATTSLRVAPTPNTPGLYGSAGVNPGLLAVGSALTPRDYQERLLQPFCDLGVSCQSADEQVCQYRLAIEVIQAYWRTRTSPLPGPGDFLRLRQARPYVEGVLEALLQAAGTSLAELRAATTASSPALATRLQLPLSVLNTWQAEFSTASLADERPLDEVEAALARAFGLAATATDPLRTGQLIGDNTGPIRLVRWSLQGVEWGINTDPNGLLNVRVEPSPASSPSGPTEAHVTVYQGFVAEDNVVARGTLLLSSPASSTYTGLLHPQHGSGLRGSVVATVTGTDPADFSISVVPTAAAGRQQLLAADWLAQDAAASGLLQAQTQPSWNGQPYLVDPDLLGPDDFRVPNPSDPSGANRAYVLWRRRYDFLQTQVGGSLLGANPATSATLAGLAAIGGLGPFIDGLTTQLLTYPQDAGPTARTAWPVAAPYAGPGTALLARLHAEVASADPATTRATTTTLATLGLPIEAMQRLYDLWQRNRTLALTPAEVQEALDIVRQTVKVRFAPIWSAEEAASPAVALGLDLFQQALHEPLPGVWENVRPTEFDLADADTPRLDPDEATPLDLPDLGLGSPAADLWRARQAELLAKRQAILAYGAATPGAAPARADAMLRYALAPTAGAPLAALPGTVPGGTLEAAGALLQNEAAPQYAAAARYFGTTLALRPAEAATLLELRAQAGTQPSEALWLEMATLLARVWKRTVAYRTSYTPEDAPATPRPSWLAQERPAGTAPTLDYLLGVRKHRLLKWRAPAELRAAWVQALALAGQRPLIDPNQLVPGDFRQAGEFSRTSTAPLTALNPAYELYRQRRQWVDNRYALYSDAWETIRAGADPVAASWSLVGRVLGTTQAALEELHRQLHAGTDVSAPLRRLLLPPAGLDLLYDEITNAPGADRAAEVPHLLVLILCQRRYAEWAREEIARGLVPQPRYFREPAAEAESLATLPWRSSAVARRQWQRRLAARFGQAQAVAAAQQQAVRTAEDQYLPLLRDALLLAKVGAPTDTLAARATALGELYFIDFQTVCCQHTTRVALASEVIQKVFLNLRGGLAANGLTLPTAGSDFEQDWQWLSSYERWRALMFLYLYPQNVLLPALKPGQSSQFRLTVQGLRQGTGLSPAGARQYMDDYQAFMNDLSTLEVQAAVQVQLTAAATATAGFTTAPGAEVSVQVAVSGGHVAYANLHYLAVAEASQNSYSWTRLPGTDSVERVVGATAYRPTTQERYVYVFALLREPQKNLLATTAAPLYLAYQRLSLRTLSWEDDYTRLDLNGPGALEPRNLLVAANPDETLPPLLTGVRNRVEPLYTAAPFSLPAPSAGYSTTVSGIVGEVYNMDLFRVSLDAQGTGVGNEQTNTVFLVSELKLLSCVMLNNTQLRYTMGVQVGRQNPTVLNTLALYLPLLTPDKYIFSERLRVFADSTPQTNPGGIGYNTPVFTSSWQANLFLDFQRAVQNVVSGRTTMEVAALLSSPGINTYAADKQVPLAPSGLTIQASGFRFTDATAIVINGVTDYHNFYNDKYEFYFNRINYGINTQTLVTYKVSLAHGVLGMSSVGQSQAPGDYFASPADAVTQLTSPYTFVGPALRVGYGKGNTLVADCQVLSRAASAPLALTALTTLQQGSRSAVLHQSMPALPPLFSSLSPADQAARRTALAAVHAATPLGATGFVSSFVSEAYYALPMLLAQELTRTRNYDLALHYYRLVYDYTRLSASATPDPGRLVYPALAATGGTASYDAALAWLHNPYNPYTLAALRPGAHLDYVVMSVVRCLLAYADDEFTRDTTESVSRARTYYELAARLLKQDVTQAAVPGTAALLDPFDAAVPAAWLGEWQALKDVLARVNQRPVLEALLRGNAGNNLTWLWAEAQAGSRGWGGVFDDAWKLVNGQLDALPGGYMSLCLTADNAATGSIDLPAGALPAGAARPYVPFLTGTAFCVPTNPVPFALALQAELNLFKIRSCRNIAGIQRELDPYAAATDTTTGLPTLSSTGQLVRSGRLVVPATQFRYAYIVERARQLVSLAQQTEASLLSALEKRDAEAYNLLKARQDIATSQATVQLQTLRVTEAEDGVDLAGLNLEKSQYMQQHYTDLLSDGLNGWEEAQITAITVAGAAKALAAAIDGANLIKAIGSFGASSISAAAQTVAAIAEATAEVSGLYATYKRREDEWSYQQGLANQDIKIGQQQIRISNDQLKVVGQEKRIAQLNLDHASAVLTFLTTKFTNAELYDWMSGILENAYGYFLQQATATARLAEQQLAFERQAVPAGLIQEDYYSAPADDASMASIADGGATSATDRKGLTGSVRLLQDLTRLDEYAFETTRRKLQLTKTISLAQAFPTEFGRFRETGVLPFACQPEWFDQDFPGHYLRIVRRVRTSVIALVPPVEGIKARLSTAGTSHVTVNGAPFQTLALPRAPEAVALTATTNATGLFELEQQSTELLYPFEGLGVDVPWQFSMQPASNPGLDYSAVADVLVSLDYTALESADYARQVVQQLGTERRQLVALSLRDRFADQWYDLHHAAELAPADRYQALLTLTPADLPLHLRNAQVSQLTVLVDAPLDEAGAPGAFTDRSGLEVRLSRGQGLGGSARTNQYGVISTRTGQGQGPLYTGNATGLAPLLGSAPAGTWSLAIGQGRLRERLDAGRVNDIYLILEVTGDAPVYQL